MIFLETNKLANFFRKNSCSACQAVHSLAISASIDADAKFYNNIEPLKSHKHFTKLYKRHVKQYLKHEKIVVKILEQKHSTQHTSSSYSFVDPSF